MKYKNTSKKVMFFRVNGIWIEVQPGEIVELENRNAHKSRKELVVVDENTELTVEELKTEGTELILDKDKLKSMTKDELNDYAALVDIDVSTYMTKKNMIKKILKETDKILEEN